MNKPKVLQVLAHFSYPIAGYTTRSQEIVKNISSFSEPIIMSDQPDGVQTRCRQVLGRKFYKVPELPFRVPYLGSRMVKPYLTKLVFEQIVGENKVDIVHAHTPYALSYVPVRLAKKMGIPAIYEVRGLWEETWIANEGGKRTDSIYKTTRAKEDATMRLADKIVVISQGLYDDLLARGISRSKIAIVPNGVNLTDFCLPKIRAKDTGLVKKYQLKGKAVLGYIGTIKKMEGLDLVVRALARIKRKDIVFMVVGHGDYEDNLKALAARLGVQDQIVFVGKVDHCKIDRYYGLIDICLYPRLPEKVSEVVTPLKPLEAMAMGKFVLASSVGGLKELVKENISGVLFRAGSVKDLAKKIAEYIDDQELRLQISGSARRWVAKERDWKVLAERYRDIYASLLQ